MSSIIQEPPPTPSNDQNATTQLLTMKVFECFSPPPMNSIRGTFMPRAFDMNNRRRRKIVIEVHLVPAGKGEAIKKSDGAFYEECIIRVLDPANASEKANVYNALRIGKHNKRHHTKELSVDDFADDTSVSPSFLHAESTYFTTPDSLAGWKQKYRFPISALSIKGTHKASVIIEIILDRAKETRELIFDSVAEAEQFEAMIARELSLENRRIEKKIAANFGDKKIDATETITFLIEIVSGWNLPLGDFTSSDPYIKCWYNGHAIHKTKYISNALDPVWTVDNGSLFLMTVEVGNLFGSDGLLCVLHDFDTIGADEKLGQFSISPKQLYEANGERMEFRLEPPTGQTAPVTGHIAVRCRKATDYDIQFMNELNKTTSKGTDFLGMKAFEKMAEAKGGAGAINSILSKRTKVVKHGVDAGKKVYKIRPGPDPMRVEETTWMTKDAIQKECMKDSLNWIDTGNGPVGRLFVEIIGCDDLPQMDTGGMLGNKTDAFVQLVFEDTMGRTDTIDDSLAPRWMPWTNRAFIFHMYHASSDLFIGVFDHDESINPAEEHDLIGRIAVDLSNLRKNIVYTLTYDLYTTAQMSNLSDKRIFRKRMGTITFRLRLEIEDERKLLLATLDPPPLMFVNVKTRKDFKVLQGAAEGKYNMSRYDQDIIYSYIDELLTLKHVLLMVQDAMMSLFLWRGTFEVQTGSKSFFIPVHSITAFLVAVTLVERPQLFPSFGFFSISWLLMASMDYRSRYPDVWGRCRTFSELFQVLIFGEAIAPPNTIMADETKEKAEAFLNAWKDRIKASEEAAAKAYAESVKEQEEYEREMEGVGDESDLATKSHGISIDPLKIVLHPIQQQLAMVIRYVRYVKYVILWQECYLSFWITISCFVMAIICSFVPWFFLLKWSMRFLVWTVFGPWMKLVDVFYVSKIKAMTPEEEEKYKREMKEKRLLMNQGVIQQARIKREEARKLKAMKKHLFGKYIVGVPVLKVDRFIDFPLPESFAFPYTAEQRSLADQAMRDAGYKRVRIPGQHLVGDMIPKVESLAITDAPVGQATSQPNLLDKSRPGGAASSGKDSTAAAYANIGSLIFGAAIVTWFGVPFLASVTEKSLKWFVTQKFHFK